MTHQSYFNIILTGILCEMVMSEIYKKTRAQFNQEVVFAGNDRIHFIAVSEPHTPHYKRWEKLASGIKSERTLRIGFLDPNRDAAALKNIVMEITEKAHDRLGGESLELKDGLQPVRGKGINGSRETIEWSGLPDDTSFIRSLLKKLQEHDLISKEEKAQALEELGIKERPHKTHRPGPAVGAFI
ncbi:MAG: hypothetical protein KGJ06_06075 [Pseudomonadota bacterium]|nr:hypothetical protein [Pseudomonadota bacterium]